MVKLERGSNSAGRGLSRAPPSTTTFSRVRLTQSSTARRASCRGRKTDARRSCSFLVTRHPTLSARACASPSRRQAHRTPLLARVGCSEVAVLPRRQGRPEEDVEARNARRRADLLAGRYESPFLVGIDVFFMFPSPASAPAWSGVSGLVKLFGRPGLRTLATAERTRLTTIPRHVTGQGAVVAFQKDAYEHLRDQSAPPYMAADALAGRLRSESAAGCPVRLFGAPPTRYAHTEMFPGPREYAEAITDTGPPARLLR